MKIYEARESYVYAVKCGPFYKVGRAANLEARVQTMQSGNPFRLTIALYVETTARAAPKAEFRVHQALARFRHRDEWFRCPLHVIRAAILEAVEVAEAKVHPKVKWFEKGRFVYDRPSPPL